jgi:transcriptional regulator with XRE-family HTH domain
MPENIREIFAKNLRYFMEKNKISQADICRELKVSSATVSDWCNGAKYPRPDAIGHLADLLGVRFSMLTTEEGPANYKDQERLEAFHQDPRLGMLFDRVLKMPAEDKNKITDIYESILKSIYGDD